MPRAIQTKDNHGHVPHQQAAPHPWPSFLGKVTFMEVKGQEGGHNNRLPTIFLGRTGPLSTPCPSKEGIGRGLRPPREGLQGPKGGWGS